MDAKVALITGYGNSLGRAVAAALARSGFRLALLDENNSEAQAEALEDIKKQGVDVCVLPSDSGALAPQRTLETFGRLDCLVNLLVPTPEADPQSLYQRPMKLLALSLAAAELIEKSAGRGAIVNHCFLPSAFAGTELEATMPAIKGAMTGITRTLCRTLGRRNICVNCIQTGLMEMPEVRAIESARVRDMKPPLGRRGTPEDMARLTTFLAVRNRYWTGQPILLDGGLTSGLTGT